MGSKLFTTVHSGGYVQLNHEFKSEVDRVLIHRLVAVAKYGFDAVVDMETHHSNGVPWDNRRSNVELVTTSGHRSKHEDTHEWKRTPWRDEGVMRRLYIDRGMSGEDIADELSCANGTAYNWLHEHGLIG